MPNLNRLATMIVRSGAELNKLFSTIDYCGFLGQPKLEGLELFNLEYPDVIINQSPREREGKMRPDWTVDPADNVFGFWLPHGMNGENDEIFVSQIRQCTQRFNMIEAAFRKVECIPQEHLWLESEQAEFFENNPDKLSGSKNDHPDVTVVVDLL
jgi:hypothetical protein